MAAMRRRDFLAGGLACTQTLAARVAFGQPASPKRAAVVIGVNKTGNLPILRAAVSSAHNIADWLTGEKFDVRVIVDEHQPVTAAEIKKSVFELVKNGTLDQLVVYFSGHGFAVANNEFWLLTGAPEDASEAVSVIECVDFARKSAIPNVTFISDACRSIPSFNVSQINGTVVFPNLPISAGAPQPEVDRFFATLPGAAAYEVATVAADKYRGIYTATFLDAFRNPNRDMLREVNGAEVIPNRNLKKYLAREVPRRLSAVDIQHNQVPDSRVESGDDTYIGHAHLTNKITETKKSTDMTIFNVVDAQFVATGLGPLYASFYRAPNNVSNQLAINRLEVDSGFEAAQAKVLTATLPESFTAKSGFTINGARLKSAAATGGTEVEILDAGDGESKPGLVQVSLSANEPVSCALLFENGTGTVIAALPGFVGTLVADHGRVTNVNYVPSRASSRWGDYMSSRERLDKLRALVATAAKFGVFRLEGDKETRQTAGRRLADQIRVLKGIDPTLGLYAAYAYADANLTNQVRSVQSFMRNDLGGADLFDVALLTGALSGRSLEGRAGPVPFCPMLAQGWQLLRVKDVQLSSEIAAARGRLLPALWTTFDAKGMDYVLEAVSAGKLR